MPRLPVPIILLVIGLAAACRSKAPPAPAPPAPDPTVSYTHEVRPLLAGQCLPCHGPHDGAHHAGLRLDTFEFATAAVPASGARPIVPGDPDRSSLLSKLFVVPAATTTPTDPTDPAHTVTPAQHALLQRWIAQGAHYEPHWAFQPLPAELPAPENPDHGWALSTLDHLTLQRLQNEHRAPAPPMDPLSWFRRATLDLTGLPPGSAALAAFRSALAASGDTAALRADTADRLLASPAHAEHLATLWLKTARYADTFDSNPDHPNNQWPYRDWVVRAFQENLPYDRFLTYQLAGDQLPDPTNDQLLATALFRLGPLHNDPSLPTDGEIQRLAAGRVETFGRTMLGLNLECARCHHHPTDPLAPADFHSLLAFFNSVPESGRFVSPTFVPAPTLHLPTGPQLEALLNATTAEAATAARLAETITAAEPAFREWLATPGQLPLISDLLAAFSFDEPGDRAANQVLGGTGHALHPKLASAPGIRGKALQLNGTNPVLLPAHLPAGRTTPWTYTFWLKLPDAGETPASGGPIPLLARPSGTGPALTLEAGHLTASITLAWPDNALAIRTTAPVLTPGPWHQIAFSYDGSSTAAGLRLHLDGLPLATTTTADSLWKDLPDPDPLVLGADPRLAKTLLDDLQCFSRALTSPEVAHLHDSRSLTDALAAADPAPLRDYYISSIDPRTRGLAVELATCREAVVRAEIPVQEVSILRESTPRASGNRATPVFLPPLQPADPGAPTRLDLARWLTRPDHPLAARLFVNRLWASFFGGGLVSTTDNLGLQSPAAHDPALLDWLARDFITHRWDVRHLCRQIVLSATYRQQSTLHQHAPLPRRDALLVATGLLDPTAGGPPAIGPRRALYAPWPRPANAPDLCPVAHPDIPLRFPQAQLPAPLTEDDCAEFASILTDQVLTTAPRSDAGRLAALHLALTGRPPSLEELATLGTVVRNRQASRSPDESDPGFWIKICHLLLAQPQ